MRGLLVHRLLQSLPDIAPERRTAAAFRVLRAQAPGLSEADAKALVAEVEAALADPASAPLFAKSSRAEAAIAARIERPGEPALDIAGRIDRIAEVGGEVWIADFKTGAPPASPPQAYVAQLALYRAAAGLLYPGRAVRAFILWTAGPRLEEIAVANMEMALAAL